MRNYWIIGMLLGLFLRLSGQYESGVTYPDTSLAILKDNHIPQVRFASTITQEDMKKHLTELASDAYEGRETGEPGNYKAAEYLSQQLSAMGYPTLEDNTYYQPIAFSFTSWKENNLTVDSTSYRHLWDYLAFSSKNESMIFSTDEVLFLGYGIDDNRYSDYDGKNVKDKVLLVYEGEPRSQDSTYLLTGTREATFWSDNESKLKVAMRKGAKAMLIIHNDIKTFLGENRRLVLGRSTTLGNLQKEEKKLINHLYISTDIAKAIIGDDLDKVIKAREDIRKKRKSKTIKIKTDISFDLKRKISVLSGYNVLGYLEGTTKKDELVIVSAHYDHIGKRADAVFNGADDNGSGTTTVLELAEAMMLAKKAGKNPKRSILFLWVTGEEKGLLGSEFYAANPIFPLTSTIANVNIDMVGRVDEKYKDNPNYIYVIGSDRLSTELHEINEAANAKYVQLVLDYQYNDEKDPNRFYYRSDHYNFAKNGIPSIFFFNGTHADYHRSTDTVEKIHFPKMQKIGKLIFHLVWELANQSQAIKVDAE